MRNYKFLQVVRQILVICSTTEEKMQKYWKITAVLMLAVLALAACGGKATEAPTPAATTAPTEAAATTAPTTAPTEAAASPEMCQGAQPGDEVTLLYQWSGQEEERWNQIVKPLVDACGIVLIPESTRDQALLDTRVQAGTPDRKSVV